MDYRGLKVLVMGLGLHGGGLETAKFLLKRGADISVTDLRDEKTLSPSIKQLDASCKNCGGKPVRYILGRHEIDDFKKADIVIKNPGVRNDSPFLRAAKRTETDISLFLSESPARLFAVTGTKGKSCTSSALHWCLNRVQSDNVRKAYLGGNITVSPLTFLDELAEYDDVVLELSSFQLGDLRGRIKEDGSPLLKPAAAVITPVMSDHQDRYASMEEYVNDKRVIYQGQDESCFTIAHCKNDGLRDDWGESFLAKTKGRPITLSYSRLPEGKSGGWLEEGRGFARLCAIAGFPEEEALLVPSQLLVAGAHQKMNLLAAALAVYAVYGSDGALAGTNAGGSLSEKIQTALSSFPGIEHRLEMFLESGNIRFYNDSAATIPEAAAACIESLAAPERPGNAPLVLVTGGTDKNLDFSPLAKKCANAAEIILLAGSGSDKLRAQLGGKGIPYNGPYDNLETAVNCALEKANALKKNKESFVNVALSPGCASFEMFLNEFDRGNKWKEAVIRNAQ